MSLLGRFNSVTNGRFQALEFNDSCPAINLMSGRSPGDPFLPFAFLKTGQSIKSRLCKLDGKKAVIGSNNRSFPPTKHERVMRADDFIVSKTDLRSLIIYCNPIFIEFSGFTEHELLGKQHNSVRYSNIPGIFELLWNIIKPRN
jgi:hypothetical protein